MLEKQFETLADLQEKYPIVILFGILLVTLFLGYYALDLKTDSSFDSMYRDDSNTTVLGDLVANEFGSTDELYILVSIDEAVNDASATKDIREPAVLQSMKLLLFSLFEEPSVSNVISVVDALEQVYGRLPETLEESKEMIANLPFDTSQFISDDFSAANMIVEVNIASKPGSLETAQEAIEEKIADSAKPSGVITTLTGEPVLLNRIMYLLIRDNGRTILFSLFAIFLILWYYFKSPSLAFVGLQPVILALVWLAGTLVLMDIRVSMMTAAVGAMMVGMGIDYSIHMVHGYHENVKKGRSDVTKRTVVYVGGALFASGTTTIAGFLAMLLGISPSSQTQGMVLAFGILYSLLASLFALPCLLVIHRKLLYSDLDKAVFAITGDIKKSGSSFVKNMLHTLATFQAKVPGLIIAAFVIATIFIVPGMAFVRLDTDNENWIPENDDVMEALDEVGYKFGGLDSQSFLVMIDKDAMVPGLIRDLRHPDVLHKVAEFSDVITDLEFIDSFRSPTNDIRAQNEGRIPQNIETIKDILEENPQIKDYFNKDYSIMRITAVSDAIELDGDNNKAYYEMLKEAETIQMPEGVKLIGQGNIAQWIELDELLAADTVRTTMIGFVFVFLLAIFFYRSLTVGFLAIIPIVFAGLWTMGFMGYIDLPFTVLTSGMLAIVMGMGIDFSIHLIHGVKVHLSEGHSLIDSITETLTSEGEAITTSTITTMAGFGALMFATLLATRRLGATLAIAVFSAFAICLILVPATLAFEYKLKKRFGGRKS